MAEKPTDAKKELELMTAIYDELEALPIEGRQRVIAWVSNALGVQLTTGSTNRMARPKVGAIAEAADRDHNIGVSGPYGSFAELYDAAGPTTNRAKALVGGYWFQECLRAEDFVSMDVNNELKNVGANVSNITVAFDGLINTTPRLVLQVKKSGKAQQARKRYKLTVAGIRAVEAMINDDGKE